MVQYKSCARCKKTGIHSISATCPIVSNIEKQIKMEIENK